MSIAPVIPIPMQKCVMLLNDGVCVFLCVHEKCDSGTIREIHGDDDGREGILYLYNVEGFTYQALQIAPSVGAEMKRLERCAFAE